MYISPCMLQPVKSRNAPLPHGAKRTCIHTALKLRRNANSHHNNLDTTYTVPWVVEDAGEGVGEEGLDLEGVAVLKTRRSLGVVHHQANGIREYT